MTLGDRQTDTQEVGETPLSLLSSLCLSVTFSYTRAHTHTDSFWPLNGPTK